MIYAASLPGGRQRAFSACQERHHRHSDWRVSLRGYEELLTPNTTPNTHWVKDIYAPIERG